MFEEPGLRRPEGTGAKVLQIEVRHVRQAAQSTAPKKGDASLGSRGITGTQTWRLCFLLVSLSM